MLTKVVLPLLLLATGLCLTIAEHDGLFPNEDRLTFVLELRATYRATADTVGAKEFIERFYTPKRGRPAAAPQRFALSGTVVGDVVHGTAVLADGAPLCTMADVEAWAHESPDWIFRLGVALALIGGALGPVEELRAAVRSRIRARRRDDVGSAPASPEGVATG